MSSILFNNKTSPRPPKSHLANLTLANLQDAQDATVTALPQPPAAPTIDTKPTKDSVWKRIIAKIKNTLLSEWKRTEKTEEENEMCISEPTGFKHVKTSGPRPLMAAIPVVVREEESDWEDMEQSEAGRDSVWIRR
jgi:hypothetical protein